MKNIKNILMLFIFTIFFNNVFSVSKKHRTIWANEANIVSSVTDTNLTISGTNTLDADINISAIANDVTITIDSSGAVLRGDAVLTLNAGKDKTITFLIQGDLTFSSIDAGIQARLPIILQGAGQVIFEITPGKTLRLQSEERTNGAHIMLGMQHSSTTVFFKKNNTITSLADAWIEIAEKSSITFCTLPQTNSLLSATAAMTFDVAASASAPGGIVLRIENRGSFFIDPGLNFDGTLFTLEPLAINTGNSAMVSIINSNNAIQGTFIILNSNKVVPNLTQDLRNQRVPYGFSLGRKSILNISDYVTVSYGALSGNHDVRFFIDDDSISTNFASVCKKEQTSSCGRKSINPSAFSVRGFCNNQGFSQINLAKQSALLFFAGYGAFDECITFDKTQQLTLENYCNIRDYMIRGHGDIVLDLQGDLLITGRGVANSLVAKLSLPIDPHNAISFGGTFPSINYTMMLSSQNQQLLFNNSCFMQDCSTLSLVNILLNHEDLGHDVPYEIAMKKYAEPSYIGLRGSLYADKPQMQLYNSQFLLRSPACFAGVDLVVPLYRSGNVSTISWDLVWGAPFQPQLIFGASFMPPLKNRSDNFNLEPANFNLLQVPVDMSGLFYPPAHKLILDGSLNANGLCDIFMQGYSGIILADNTVDWASFTRSFLTTRSMQIMTILQFAGIGNTFGLYGNEGTTYPQLFIGTKAMLVANNGIIVNIEMPVRYGGLNTTTMPSASVSGTINFPEGFVLLEEN